MDKKSKKVITGLKKGQSIEVTTKDGTTRGIVSVLTDVLVVITLLEPLTSSRAHSYHWEAGDPYSVMFNKIINIKRTFYSNSPEPSYSMA
tara:strand:+ start:338 stop:607 length:270 start_codon:yes stop_codon:yes gene_type:complete